MTKHFALLLALACAAPLAVTGAAAEPQVTIAGSNRAALRQAAETAADRLCAAARAHDPFNDYGSQQDCVENALDHARVQPAGYQRLTQAQPATQTR